jgi:N-methylhydantoinase B
LAYGDVIVFNDPYTGGTHLEDLKLLRPVFADGAPIAVLANTGHYVDVGGAVPGGSNPSADSIFQEGIQIPPVWLYRRGMLQQDVLRLILSNTRLPGSMRGDIFAQVNALESGSRRLRATIAEFGAEFVCDCFRAFGDAAEQQTRVALKAIPRGVYDFTDFVEFGDEDLCVNVRIDVREDVHIDFTGSSPLSSGPMNLSPITTQAASLIAFKHLFPEVPLNGGCFRPFTFNLPTDCFLNARWPAALDGYSETSIRVVDCIFAALGGSVESRGYAQSCGTSVILTLAGRRSDGEYIAATFPLPGGSGASGHADGLQFAPTVIGRGGLVSLESSEHDLPIRWRSVAIREGSGGAGRFQGGPGTTFEFELLEPMHIKVMADRARHCPAGVGGGGPGEPLLVGVDSSIATAGGAGASRIASTELAAGDSVLIATPGGGGVGLAENDPGIMPDVRRPRNAWLDSAAAPSAEGSRL